MRRHKPRKQLSARALRRLRGEAERVADSGDPAGYVRRRWDSVRRASWFREVLEALRSMVGNGEPCMYCDSSEAAEVEHFKPKALFPYDAFDWNNLLWICGVCNRYKGDQFPPRTQQGAEILNPVEIDPWEYIFIESLTGLLSGVWRQEIDSPDERAESTIEIVNLNREALQERRRQRIRELRFFARDAVRQIDANMKTHEEVRKEVQQFQETASHPDVADYFLAGPGREDEPFKSLFERIETQE